MSLNNMVIMYEIYIWDFIAHLVLYFVSTGYSVLRYVDFISALLKYRIFIAI